MTEALPHPSGPPLWRRRDLALPPELEESVERSLAGIPPARWIAAARSVSDRYRAARRDDDGALVTGTLQALGYAALVLPATYAQLRGAFAAAAARLPGWAPASMLDLGTGPGTALWAATAQWPSLSALTAVDREPAFVEVGRSWAVQSAGAALRETRWHVADLGAVGTRKPGRYDLVVVGHVLNELPEAVRPRVLEEAWEQTGHLLVVVEPGTPAGFAVVRAARDRLLRDGARTVAPCAHDRACPLSGDWCHFPQRIVRPGFQRRARGAPSEWEDAKFSYTAMARSGPDEPIWGRVIREPRAFKGYAEMELSTASGIVRYRAQKRDRAAFRWAKEVAWGDTLDEPPPAPIAATEVIPVDPA